MGVGVGVGWGGGGGAKRLKLYKGYPLFIIVVEIVKVTRESAAFCERGIYLVPLERLRF